MTKTIALTGKRGGVTIVDDEDYERSVQHSWSRGVNGYVECGQRDGIRTYTLRLHRLLLDPPPGMEVDHINRNRLDNRRANLRIVTSAENKWNSDRAPRGSFGPGTSYRKGRYYARISMHGRKYYLGTFDTPEEASAAFLAARAQRDRDGKIDDDLQAPKRPAANARYGERHPYSRLTDAQRVEMCRRWMAGERPSALGRAYGVSSSQVTTIVRSPRWSALAMEAAQ